MGQHKIEYTDRANKTERAKSVSSVWVGVGVFGVVVVADNDVMTMRFGGHAHNAQRYTE